MVPQLRIRKNGKSRIIRELMVIEEINQLEEEIKRLDGLLDKQIEYIISKEMKGLPSDYLYREADRIVDRIDAHKRLIEEIKKG